MHSKNNDKKSQVIEFNNADYLIRFFYHFFINFMYVQWIFCITVSVDFKLALWFKPIYLMGFCDLSEKSM